MMICYSFFVLLILALFVLIRFSTWHSSSAPRSRRSTSTGTTDKKTWSAQMTSFSLSMPSSSRLLLSYKPGCTRHVPALFLLSLFVGFFGLFCLGAQEAINGGHETLEGQLNGCMEERACGQYC